MKFLIFSIVLLFSGVFSRGIWTTDQAWAWYQKQGFLVGSNYIPSYAINQLEMFQDDTWNATRIDEELSWAESIGMNTMRIFLHDLLHAQNPTGFKNKLNELLTITSKHGIKPLFVLFDSCWDPLPKLGPQRDPFPGIHNPGWVQAPGANALIDSTQYPRLEAYVKDVVGSFANDPRILFWDLWNEADNFGMGNYSSQEPKNKQTYVNNLLPQVFEWARSVDPIQPLTICGFDFNPNGTWDTLHQINFNNSDIMTAHSYDNPGTFENIIKHYQTRGRPIVFTEYMARPQGSTFVSILPVAKKYNVGAINWGFVSGKTQTNFPWDSWSHPYTHLPPASWFHDVFRTDGTPYMTEEIRVIKKHTGCPFGFQSHLDNFTCYNSYNTPLSWNAAQTSCHKTYSNLVRIDSSFENVEILSYAKSTYPSCSSFYIGLNKVNGVWKWAKDDTIIFDENSYRGWRSGYPSNDPNANCVVLNTDGTWTNQACDSNACYICSY